MLVVSGNSLNANGSIYIVCPITSKIKKYYGDVVLKPNKVNGLNELSEVLGFQIRTIATERLTKRIGQVTSEEMQQVTAGIEMLLRY